MEVNKTFFYKEALNNRNIFPGDRVYSIDEIYERILKYGCIPDEHFENRSDIPYQKYKNYIHTIRPSIDRIEYLGDKMYRFS